MLDPATRESRRAALQRTYERERDAALTSTLAEELERDMAIILPIPVSPSHRGALAEDSARIAMHHDDGDDYAGGDPLWQAKIAGVVILLVIGIPFVLACLALLLALVNWGT